MNDLPPNADNARIEPWQRLWTPWRMAYIGGVSQPGCVFCNALASGDDTASLIVHRGEHVFAILNLYPYNTGHLMVVPNEHIDDLGALSPAARSEMAELTASFSSGLRLVTGCDGLNIGMNLGPAAGAGIADHLHQHIVPRWTGDANFMPIIGGAKVLPELLPATYAKLRVEVARQKSNAEYVTVVLFDKDRSAVVLDEERLPRVRVPESGPIWKAVVSSIAPFSVTSELLGWGGSPSSSLDRQEAPVMIMSMSPDHRTGGPFQRHPFDDAMDVLSGPERIILAHARPWLD